MYSELFEIPSSRAAAAMPQRLLSSERTSSASLIVPDRELEFVAMQHVELALLGQRGGIARGAMATERTAHEHGGRER